MFEVAAGAQCRCKIDIIIQGIAARMSELREDLLKPDPLLFVGASAKPCILFLCKGRILSLHGRTAQKVVEILLPRGAAGAVHDMKELVKIQVIPCDVIDPESIFVVQKVLRNLGVALRLHLF